MRIKVVITYKDGQVEHYKFKSKLHLLDYQLALTLEELDSIEAFDVYPGD